ncbi:hypothetical protein RTCIAT899_PC08205 (plasmid) [Rhizobium tropici CIAT 899]|nr:hypothetical protein RTCIAT899_PC08205 [Rhizobium tropici CIAT 899]TGE97566.1 hypothetical protein C9417_13700 [Rhizobium sp. SEMIA 4088]
MHAGLVSAPFITVDDTGAGHIRGNAQAVSIVWWIHPRSLQKIARPWAGETRKIPDLSEDT